VPGINFTPLTCYSTTCMFAACTPLGIADLAMRHDAMAGIGDSWEVAVAELETHYLLDLVAL
jgi:hypothetical protein